MADETGRKWTASTVDGIVTREVCFGLGVPKECAQLAGNACSEALLRRGECFAFHMTKLECPNCGQQMTVMRGGTRRVGPSPAEQGIKTLAECENCALVWERDYGDRGRWRLPGRVYLGWDIVRGPKLREGGGGSRYATYRVAKHDDERAVEVELTGSLLATEPATLSEPYLAKAAETNGASCLYRVMATSDPPAKLILHTDWHAYE